jgi:DM DNA binding domain
LLFRSLFSQGLTCEPFLTVADAGGVAKRSGGKPKTCVACKVHAGVEVPLKGNHAHKKKCPYVSCDGEECGCGSRRERNLARARRS